MLTTHLTLLPKGPDMDTRRVQQFILDIPLGTRPPWLSATPREDKCQQQKQWSLHPRRQSLCPAHLLSGPTPHQWQLLTAWRVDVAQGIQIALKSRYGHEQPTDTTSRKLPDFHALGQPETNLHPHPGHGTGALCVYGVLTEHHVEFWDGAGSGGFRAD